MGERVKVAAAQILAALGLVPGKAAGSVAEIDRDLGLAELVVAVTRDFAIDRGLSRAGCFPVVFVDSGLKDYKYRKFEIWLDLHRMGG